MRADDVGTVSIEKLSLSLFSCQKAKLKEGNKSFVPEPRESCFSDPYVYFPYSYIGRISGSILHFFLSFFLTLKIQQKRPRSHHPFFLSFLNIKYTDTQIYSQVTILVLYIIRR